MSDTGWCLSRPSEKYESRLEWWHSQYKGKQKWSKPPTSISSIRTWAVLNFYRTISSGFSNGNGCRLKLPGRYKLYWLIVGVRILCCFQWRNRVTISFIFVRIWLCWNVISQSFLELHIKPWGIDEPCLAESQLESLCLSGQINLFDFLLQIDLNPVLVCPIIYIYIYDIQYQNCSYCMMHVLLWCHCKATWHKRKLPAPHMPWNKRKRHIMSICFTIFPDLR